MRRSLFGASSDNRSELKRVFEQYGKKDDDGQVRLYKENLKEAFEYLGALLPGYKTASVFKYIDTDNSGYIKGAELSALIEYAYRSGYR